jgi:hypothetical protein
MKVLDVLHSIGYTNLIDSGTHFRTDPLYREFRSRNTLAIQKTTGRWFDHSERSGGSLAQLIQKTLSLPSLEATKAYLGDLPMTIDVRDSVELTNTKKFDKGLLVKLLRENAYWHSRGISDRTLIPFRGGVAQNGRMKGRFVFPIFDERDDLIGFAGRILNKNENHPSWKLLGAKKNWVFPLPNAIQEKKSVILVESIGDCLSLFEIGIKNVLVLFGVCLSNEIIKTLLKYDVKKIHILLNNDDGAGFTGNLASESIVEDLTSFFDNHQVRIITPPKNDINEMLVANRQELEDFCYKMELSV